MRRPETKARYLAIVDALIRRGAEGLVLGSTELPLLIHPGDLPIPVFDSTRIHCEAIVAFALS